MSDRTAPFPTLRTAYLRAIAAIWRNDEQLIALLKGEQRQLPDGGEVVHGPTDCIPILRYYFGLDFLWDIKFRMSMAEDPDFPRPEWDFRFGNDFMGPPDRFTIFIPQRPRDTKYLADHLAAYGQAFPTLLGNQSADAPPDFAEFGVITSRFIPLAWNNDQTRIGQNSYVSGATPDDEPHASFSDARVYIQGVLDYLVKWNFRLQFQFANEPVPPYPPHPENAADPATQEYKDYWNHRFPRSIITVNVPLVPYAETDVAPELVRAAALAAYNDTSDQYPFSCA